MVFEHLHTLHLVGRDVLVGHSILGSHEVDTLYIELVDGFALVFNLSVGFHLQSWHFRNHVCYAAVLRLLKPCHAIGECGACALCALRLDLHFFQEKTALLERDGHVVLQ